METYFFYIGKAALPAGAFYLAYLALFQNRKQFVFNRIYLPVSLALSFMIPLITFTTVKYIEASAIEANSFTYLSSVIFQYGEKDENGEIIIKTITRQNTTTDNQQKDALASVKENSVYFKVEEMPEFSGGESALKKYIQENLRYPPIALEKGIWGKVYVSIIISNEGKVSNPMIVRGVDPYLNKEALRVISSLPDWKPGKQNGMPVNVHYTIPVDFVLKNYP